MEDLWTAQRPNNGATRVRYCAVIRPFCCQLRLSPRRARGDDGLTRGAADRVLDAAHDERRESDRDHRTGGDEPPRLEDLGAGREAGRNLDNIL